MLARLGLQVAMPDRLRVIRSFTSLGLSRTSVPAGTALSKEPSGNTHTYKAALIDAAGTLLQPSEPAALVYLRAAAKYGVVLSEREVLHRFRRAYNTPWEHSHIRYVGDGRPFWKYIVAQSTGCNNSELFEEIYKYYEDPRAWGLAPGAAQSLERMHAAGIKLAVVSNFDTRLRPLLDKLGILHLFDEVIVSAELGIEKPNPMIFETALRRLGVKPEEAIHVGDDRRNDVWGARDAGVTALLWGVDVHTFRELADKLMFGIDPFEDENIAWGE